MILKARTLVLVGVLYYVPRTLILNEFLWETEDEVPSLPRVTRFLDFWAANIDATISEVRLCQRAGEWRRADHLLRK